jgi:serine beta-lactamase-like protein LACTB
MHRKALNFISFVCLLTSLLTAPAAGQTWKEQITEAAQAELEQNGTPSLQIAIGHKGKIIFEGAYGLSDVENDVAATPRARYRTASISKWMTATAAMKLVEQGKLVLDESIQTYCPQFPEKRWPITTRQLLTHTSGVRHYADYEGALTAASTDAERADIERRQYQDALGTYTRYTNVLAPLDNFKNDPLMFEPGTSWLYTSFGYRVLGCVLEGAAGRSYRTLMEDEVFRQVGMTSTVPDDAWAIIPHRAAGYRLNRGEPLRRADMRDVSENLPAGGHLTTATNLIAFAQAFYAEQLVSAETIAIMTNKLSMNSGETEDYTSWRHAIPSRDKYAYGIMSFPNEKELWIGHTGQQAGASTIVVLVPERNLSIAVLTNLKGWGGYLNFVRTIYSIVERDVATTN